jgi:hypothetical protein
VRLRGPVALREHDRGHRLPGVLRGFCGHVLLGVRNLKIAAVLLCIAFMFQKLLGVSLPLY